MKPPRDQFIRQRDRDRGIVGGGVSGSSRVAQRKPWELQRFPHREEIREKRGHGIKRVEWTEVLSNTGENWESEETRDTPKRQKLWSEFVRDPGTYFFPAFDREVVLLCCGNYPMAQGMRVHGWVLFLLSVAAASTQALHRCVRVWLFDDLKPTGFLRNLYRNTN